MKVEKVEAILLRFLLLIDFSFHPNKSHIIPLLSALYDIPMLASQSYVKVQGSQSPPMKDSNVHICQRHPNRNPYS